jgi:hypothetical protein
LDPCSSSDPSSSNDVSSSEGDSMWIPSQVKVLETESSAHKSMKLISLERGSRLLRDFQNCVSELRSFCIDFTSVLRHTLPPLFELFPASQYSFGLRQLLPVIAEFQECPSLSRIATPGSIEMSDARAFASRTGRVKNSFRPAERCWIG